MSDFLDIPAPTLVPLGDSALLVRFGTELTEAANVAAIALTRVFDADPPMGVIEISPNLVSVLLRYDPLRSSADAVAGEVRLRLFGLNVATGTGRSWTLQVRFDGPDLAEVAEMLGLSAPQFVAAHNASPLRVLATGFAPGFIYCGLHPPELVVPRRQSVRSAVPVGSVLFAAGQTAISATELPTGWHLIGQTDFVNFDADAMPPTRMQAGDTVQFEAVA
jgi:inhibitor of KinA